MAITPQQYYKIGENKLIEQIQQRFGRKISLEDNPELRTTLEAISVLLYNSQREIKYLQQQFIEDPLTYQTLTRTTKLPASLAKGKITFNATIVGVTIDETNTLQGANNIFYDPLDTYESIAISIPILNITSDGLGTITVETSVDLNLIATGNIANIVNVDDSDFDANDVIINITGLRTLTYSKSISAKTSTGGNIESITLTIEVESQTFGEIGNLSNGKIVNILSPLANLSVNGYVNFTNITGGTDEESDEAFGSRILIKLSQDITTNNDANMRNKALECPGTTRAWVETSQLTSIINVWHMRDGSTPPFPTEQDNDNLKNHLINTGAISAGIRYDNVIVQAPTDLSYNIEFTILYNELNNDQYKNTISQSLQKLFDTLDLNQKGSISSIKSTITTETITFYPEISQTSTLLDNLIDGIIITYDTTITGVIIATLGTITYPL
jgi:uncharacterized phage protein gp47/JayE